MKAHKATPALEILVDVDRDAIVEFESELGRVKMIPFKGTVDCPLFKGIIEPCGVDTQVTNQNDVRHMSARYMLTGKDADGADCHIYIENNAWFTNGEQPKPFRTVPIVGASRPEQIIENAAILRFPDLTAEELASIEEILK